MADSSLSKNRRSIGSQTIGLFVALLICFAAAGLGATATTPKIAGWYAGLTKPDWTPPDWLFGPVWSCLYAMMAVAVWLIWRQETTAGSKTPLLLFSLQLILNSLWSVLFFGLENPGLAVVNIVLLWGAILATLVSFWSRSKLAGAMLVPYLLWVSFATVLNIAIWQMNT